MPGGYHENVLGVPALNKREALANLLDALAIAVNTSRQLALYTDRSEWILVSQKFGDLREVCSKMAQAGLIRAK